MIALYLIKVELSTEVGSASMGFAPLTRLQETRSEIRRAKACMLQCSKYWHKCSGYDGLPSPRKTPNPHVTNKLLPKSQHSVTPSWPFPLSIAVGFNFRDERECHYFRLFKDQISSELSGPIQRTLWCWTVLQACENKYIPQLTIATEALKRGLISPKDNSVSHLRDRDYALQQYGKGLGEMQAALDKSKDNLRVALIAALLIFVFESMNGNTKAAVKNVQSAQGVINNTLKCQCHLPFSKHEPFPSNLSDVVEANLLVPFIRSGRHAVALLAGNKSSRPKPDRYFGFQRYLEDYRIPSSFRTICEARRYYECIHFRVFPEHQWEKRLPDSTTLPEEISASACCSWKCSPKLLFRSASPISTFNSSNGIVHFRRCCNFLERRMRLPLM